MGTTGNLNLNLNINLNLNLNINIAININIHSFINKYMNMHVHIYIIKYKHKYIKYMYIYSRYTNILNEKSAAMLNPALPETFQNYEQFLPTFIPLPRHLGVSIVREGKGNLCSVKAQNNSNNNKIMIF